MDFTVVQLGDAHINPARNEFDRGHHLFIYEVTVTGYTAGNTIIIRNNALGGNEYDASSTGTARYILPLSHCGNFQHSGCVHNIEVFEKNNGTQVAYASHDITIHNEPFYNRLYSKSPYVGLVTCGFNDDLGSDAYYITIEGAVAGQPVNMYLEGSVSGVFPYDTITANSGGQATFIVPNTTSGLALFTVAESGKNESMPTNGVDLFGNACDHTLTGQVRVVNIGIACTGTNADVTPNVVGGSGSYTYSFTNNETDWQSLGVLSNQAPGTYHLYIRDEGTNQRTAVSYIIDCINTTTVIGTTIIGTTIIGTTIVNTTTTIPPATCINADKLLVTMSDITPDMVTNVKCTYSYNLSNDAWISAHDYTPSGVFSLRNTKVISFDKKSIYRHNVNNKCVFYDGIVYASYVTPVITNIDGNDLRPSKAILLRSINWNCDFLDSERRKLDKTFTDISVHNSYQSTHIIKLKPITRACKLEDIDRTFNVKLLHNKWYFNRLVDSIIDRSLHSYLETICDFVVDNVQQVSECRPFGAGNIRLIDDHFIIKLTYNNVEQLDMRFYDIGAEIKKVSNHGIFN